MNTDITLWEGTPHNEPHVRGFIENMTHWNYNIKLPLAQTSESLWSIFMLHGYSSSENHRWAGATRPLFFPTWQLMPACVGDINSSQGWKLTSHLLWHPAHIPEKEGISICIMSQQNGIFGKGPLLDNGKTMPPWRTPSEIPGAKKCDLVCKGYCTSARPP